MMVDRVLLEGDAMWYEVAAKIPGFGCSRDNVGCFDPTVVIGRLKEAFPEAEVDAEDRAWRDFEGLKRLGEVEGERPAKDASLRIAASDARRRGPIWAFELPTAEGTRIRGYAERYCVRIGARSRSPRISRPASSRSWNRSGSRPSWRCPR
jgi:hypothetical protein